MKQVERNSGTYFNFLLDPVSMEALVYCRDKLGAERVHSFSNGIIVRAALRRYKEELEKVLTKDQLDHEYDKAEEARYSKKRYA